MAKRRNNRRNRSTKPRCIGVVVDNPNSHKPLRNSTFGDLFSAFATTLPQKKLYRFEDLMAMKKQALLDVASKEGVKVWKCWNKTKLANTIIGEV